MGILPTDGFAAAEFVMRHLCRPVAMAPERVFRAAAETAQPIGGDDWIWTDDNAKLLEFVSRPEIWARFPGEAADMLRFVEAMCRGPFIFRRLSTPRLERLDDAYPVTNYVHSLMHFRSDLTRGAVMAGIRFHDGRTADNVALGGNAVEFTCNGRRNRLNVAEAISAVSSELRGHQLTLRHAGDLYFNRLLQRRTRLGRITYVYTIDARSMVIGVEATLDVDPAAAVSDVILTIGQDQLSHGHNGVFYNTLAVNRPGAAPLLVPAGETGYKVLPIGGASYYSIAQPELAGFALAVHSLPREPERLAEIETIVEARGWWHLASARYRFPGDCCGTRLVAAEDKMLTAGGFYDRVADYEVLLRKAVAAGPSHAAVIDYSVSYDYGAEINAFAKCFAVCSNGAFAGAAKLAAISRNLFDTYLAFYDECFVAGHYQNKNTILSRQLAFVMLGLATMYRATQATAYLDKLKELTNVLLDFEVRFEDVDGTPASAFPYGIHSQRAAWVDGHSAALLALTHAARFVDDSRLAPTIERGIASYCWETCVVGQPPKTADLVCTAIFIDGIGRHTENSYWNFNVGLTLRFFNALRTSPLPELRAIADRYRERLALFELVMRRQLERSMTVHDDSIEFRTAMYSAETNSETQPWVMLGLLGHPYD